MALSARQHRGLLIPALACLVFLLAPGLTAPGQAQTGHKQAAHVDAYGDPLPENAVARLGTLRLYHSDGIAAVALSPDGKVVASGGREPKFIPKSPPERPKPPKGRLDVNVEEIGLQPDFSSQDVPGRVCLWDVRTGKLLREIKVPGHPVDFLHFTPDGRGLVVAYCQHQRHEQGDLCLLDVATGKFRWQTENGLRGYGNRKLVFAAAGDKLIHYRGYSFQVLDGKTGKLIPRDQFGMAGNAPEAPSSRLWLDEEIVSPDGQCTAQRFGSCWYVFDNRTRQLRQKIHDVPERPRCLEFSPDSQHLAVVAGQGLWLIRAKDGTKRLLVKKVPDNLEQLEFLANGKVLLSEHRSALYLWAVPTGKQLAQIRDPEKRFSFSADGRLLAATVGDVVRLIDLPTGRQVSALPEHRLPSLVQFSLSTRHTLFSRDIRAVSLWDTRTWKLKETLEIPHLPNLEKFSRFMSGYPASRDPRDAELSMAKQIFIKSEGKQVLLRDLKTGRVLRPLARNKGDHSGEYFFSADGNRLLEFNGDRFHFYDVATGKRLSTIANIDPQKSIGEYGLSPSGDYFARRDIAEPVIVFDVASAKMVSQLASIPEPDTKITPFPRLFPFSTNGRFLLGQIVEPYQSNGLPWERTGMYLFIWDVKTGHFLQKFQIRTEEELSQPARHPRSAGRNIGTVAVSPNHRLVAVVLEQSWNIEIWETATGRKRGELTGHQGRIISLSFSPDGRYLASSSADTTTLIWDMRRPLPSGQRRKRLAKGELAACWQTLSQTDARKADMAIGSLVRVPQDSLAFLEKHLAPMPPVDRQRVEKLLIDLDSQSFKVRHKATLELEELGGQALPSLEKALPRNNSLEKNLRLQSLVEKLHQPALLAASPEQLRRLRALEVLEKIGTSEAQNLLQRLTQGSQDARLAREAQAALRRLQGVAKP